MEANRPRVRLVALVGIALLAAGGLAVMTASGVHTNDDVPYCEGSDSSPGFNTFEAARIRSTGYVEGKVTTNTGVDDEVHGTLSQTIPFFPVPTVWKDRSHWSSIRKDIHVFGEPITLVYPPTPNNPEFLGDDLPNDKPRTQLETRAYPLQTSGTKTLTGPMRVEMIFTGRIIVWEPESYRCHDTNSDTIHNKTARKVELEGLGTKNLPFLPRDRTQEKWGKGLAIEINDP